MFSPGGLVGCTTKTSAPRMFSSMRTNTSPSAKRVQVTLHSSAPRVFATSAASGQLAVPERILKPRADGDGASSDGVIRCLDLRKGNGLRQDKGGGVSPVPLARRGGSVPTVHDQP